MKNRVITETLKTWSVQLPVLLFCLMLLACNGLLKPGFDGTYVNSAGSEFSVANDTLVVELVEGNEFRVLRKTGFRLLDEQDRAGELQHETEVWKAVLDTESHVLKEQRYGKVIGLSEDGKVLTAGRRKYQRIN